MNGILSEFVEIRAPGRHERFTALDDNVFGTIAFGDDEMIRFAFKMTVWGFLGLMILPSLVPADEAGTIAAADAGTNAQTSIHAARFAGAVAEDMGSLCTRQPALCESGRALADAALARAHQGLVIAAGFIERAQAGDEAAQSPQEGA